MKLYLFRTVRLSIIRSLFTVHTAMVYVIQVCRQLSSGTRLELRSILASLLHDFFSTPALYSQSKLRPNLTSQVLPSCLATLYSMHNFFLSTHNDPKSCHNFKLRTTLSKQCRNTTSYNSKIPGIALNTKLNWKGHIIKKRKQMDIRHKEFHWLLGRKSNLSVDNKLLPYKSIITPTWTYGIELWGCASKSHIAVIQRCQSKILRAIVDTPWYVTNDMIHKDLGIPAVQEVIHERRIKHRTKLDSHPNTLLQPISRGDVIRRLNRRWLADL
jgi:hypothetical protein